MMRHMVYLDLKVLLQCYQPQFTVHTGTAPGVGGQGAQDTGHLLSCLLK